MPMTNKLLTIQEFINTVKISEIERLTVLRVYSNSPKKTVNDWIKTLSDYAFIEQTKDNKIVPKKLK